MSEPSKAAMEAAKEIYAASLTRMHAAEIIDRAMAAERKAADGLISILEEVCNSVSLDERKMILESIEDYHKRAKTRKRGDPLHTPGNSGG